MEISARNTLRGTVKTIEHGAVNSEVTIELPGGIEIVSIITKNSTERLALSPGSKVYAVIKASDVMVATD
ncbi:MAG: TOBE domain-containing protein [Pyrinomonadaceae bacterium]|nr:TOBE domain-containing protein [Pyrinomonadaceae bacterium]